MRLTKKVVFSDGGSLTSSCDGRYGCNCYSRSTTFKPGDSIILLVPPGRSSKVKNLRRPCIYTGKNRKYSNSISFQVKFIDDGSFSWITGSLSYWHKY